MKSFFYIFYIFLWELNKKLLEYYLAILFLFYIFGNELTNNILVSKIEESGGVKKTKLCFMGVDRHFHDYYQYAEELEGSDSNWGYNEFDNQYFNVVILGFCLYMVDRELLFKTISEVDRTLKQGGYLVIADCETPFPVKLKYEHVEGLILPP